MTGAPDGIRHPALAAVITHHYRSLQGYVVLPVLWPLLVLTVLEVMGWGAAWTLWLAFASMAASLVGAILVGRWYQRRYGLVRTAADVGPRHRVALRAVLFGFACATASLFLSRGLNVDLLSSPWFLVASSLFFVWQGWRMRPLIPCTLALASLLALLTFAPLGRLPVFANEHPFTFAGVQAGLMLMLGLTYALESHRALTRALPEPSPETSP